MLCYSCVVFVSDRVDPEIYFPSSGFTNNTFRVLLSVALAITLTSSEFGIAQIYCYGNESTVEYVL